MNAVEVSVAYQALDFGALAAYATVQSTYRTGHVVAQAEMSDDGGHSDDGEDDDADADGMLVRWPLSRKLHFCISSPPYSRLRWPCSIQLARSPARFA